MKLATLFSGGKDSCLALHKVLQQGNEVLYLLCVFPKTRDSFMFHKPYLELLSRQAEELGIELIVIESKGEKENELEDLRELILKVKDKIEGIAVGGIASNYQDLRVKKICDDLGLEFFAPLWDYNPEKLWSELLGDKFEVVITKISCDGLGKEWLGRVIGWSELAELKKLAGKFKFRLDFEGGEAETAVLFMPAFEKKIRIEFDTESEGEFRHSIENLRIRD